MQEYWELYMKSVDGHPASVLFNAGISEELILEDKPYLGFIKLQMNEPSDKGFMSESEEIILSNIEDRLEMEALRYRIGNYVGRIISDGKVTFLYYLKYAFEWPDVVKAAMTYFQEYSYEYGTKEDEQYLVYQNLLYPTEIEWQMIHNHKVCDRLFQNGDNLILPRAIEHTAYFRTADGRESYGQKLREDSYNIKEFFETELELGFGIRFYRIDRPYYYDIDAITIKLIEWARLYSGEYDGWETSIVKV